MPFFPILVVILSACFLCTTAETNFNQCLAAFQHGDYGTEGGVDFNGNPVTNITEAVGVTYLFCKTYCGEGQEEFVWSNFSQQFSSWLLPWLALVSQLPFGAENRLDNLISVVLTVGSPTLAAYSLAITVINSRWVHNRFKTIKYPNRKNAARALDSLQQIPLHIIADDGLLASLVVLPENDNWWVDIVERLDYNYTWSIATATSIAWVAIAFVFTLIDSFKNLGNNLNSNGQGVGSLWLWLLPLVVGWLLVPVCGRQKLVTAVTKANEFAYVAAPNTGEPPDDGIAPAREPILAREVSDDRAISVLERRESVFRDENKTAPIFNYARFFGWVEVVEDVAEAFEHAAQRSRRHVAVRPKAPWLEADKWVEIHPSNRTGSLPQVQAYCGFPSLNIELPRPMWREGVPTRIAIASFFALALQWGTTASATLVVVFTPAVGFGCRSGSYILYGIISTLVWIMLIISSILSHYCAIHSPITAMHHRLPTRIGSPSIAGVCATLLRRSSVLLASANAVWIVVSCVFQFTNYYDTCYCNSSVLGLGSDRAYNIIAPLDNDGTHKLSGIWIGSVVLASGCVAGYTFFVNLMIDNSKS